MTGILTPQKLLNNISDFCQLNITTQNMKQSMFAYEVDLLLSTNNLPFNPQSVAKLRANGIGTVTGRLLVGTAEKIPPSELIDSTGAGDAFIGAVLYCMLSISTSYLPLSFCIMSTISSFQLLFLLGIIFSEDSSEH